MNVTVKTTIHDNRIPGIIAKFPNEVSAAVRKTAFDIQDTAQEVFCPIDTGYLAGSITSTIEPFRAEIQPAAEYAAYVELGTRKKEARPYMKRSADMHEPRFVDAIDNLVKRMLL